MDGIVLFNPAYRGAIPAPGRRRTAPDGRNHGEPGASRGARRVRRAARGNGPAACRHRAPCRLNHRLVHRRRPLPV